MSATVPQHLRTVAFLAAALLAPVAANAMPAWITEPVRLYAGPGPDYPLVGMLFPGMGVEVAGCLPGYQWCDVIAEDGRRGWTWAGVLSLSNYAPAQPVLEYGYGYGVPLVGFVIGDYWGRHYRYSPWYPDLPRWHRPPPPPPAPVMVFPPPAAPRVQPLPAPMPPRDVWRQPEPWRGGWERHEHRDRPDGWQRPERAGPPAAPPPQAGAPMAPYGGPLQRTTPPAPPQSRPDGGGDRGRGGDGPRGEHRHEEH